MPSYLIGESAIIVRRRSPTDLILKNDTNFKWPGVAQLDDLLKSIQDGRMAKKAALVGFPFRMVTFSHGIRDWDK